MAPRWRRLVAVLILAISGGASAPASARSQTLVRAYAALDAWQLEQAMTLAAPYLYDHPDAPEARTLAAEVMHQRGEHEAALALLGLSPVPTKAEMGALIDAREARRLPGFLPQLIGSGEVAPLFESLETRHFIIRFHDKDRLMAWYAQDVLEAAYTRIGADLGALVAEQGERIVVEIYPTAPKLAQATGLTVQEIENSGTIAVCKFHRLMVVSALATSTGYSWADTLAHELTHLMISKRSHNQVPVWLHEGIAKYWETRWRGNAGQALGAHAEKRLIEAGKKNALIALRKMHPSMAKLPTQQDTALAFAEVFVLVEHLVKTRGTQAIAGALAHLGEGVPFERVLREDLGGTLETLERQLRRAVTQRKRAPGAALAPVPVTLRASEGMPAPKAAEVLDPETEKLVRLGELLMLQDHAVEAADPLARAYARPNGKTPALALRLAQAWVAAGRPKEAMQALAETLTTDPQGAEAHVLYARLLLDHQAPQEAILHLRAACLQNPFNPEVHALWSRAAEALHDAPTAQREKAFETLAQRPRAPWDPPAPTNRMGRLRLITVPWHDVRLDTESAARRTPLWDVALPPGPHTVQAAAGPTKRQPFAVASQGPTTVPFDLRPHRLPG